MEQSELVKIMPLRRLVLLGFAGLGAGLLLGLDSAWLIFGGAGHVWGAVAAGGLTAAVWWILDRQRHIAHAVVDQFSKNGNSRFHRKSHDPVVLWRKG